MCKSSILTIKIFGDFKFNNKNNKSPSPPITKLYYFYSL